MSQTNLAQLQKLDSDIDAARRQLSEREALLADRHELTQAEAEARAATASAGVARGKLRDRELELQTLEARIADLDQKLYSGRIRNPKELEGYDREARMYKQNRGKLEETVLALMDDAEQADFAAQGAQKKLDATQTAWHQSEQIWQREMEDLRARLDELQASVAAIRATLAEDTLVVYDRLRRRTPVAVAPVRGQLCGACGIGLSSATLQRAHADSASLTQCDNCGRIVYAE